MKDHKKERAAARIKAKELVAQMTLSQKAGQLRYEAEAVEELNVPGYNYWNEGLHGVARAGTATMFPQAIGLAAAFDDEMMQQIGDIIATEGRAKYNAYSSEEDRDIYKGLTYWSPNINIFRDPRWGRGHETYGEDPCLTSRLGVKFVEGLQGDGEVMKAAACAKHFAVHSGPEALRHQFDAHADMKDLWETYLPAFEALVKEADVEAVMGAYNRTNGEPTCAHHYLMEEVLRGKWHFDGHFVSDCWAINDFHENHKVTANANESAALALKRGCDLNCGSTYQHMMEAYREGLVSEEDITRSAERMMTVRYLLGLFDGSEYDSIPYEKVECREHLDAALDAARKGCVLLKNNGVLPLDKNNIRTIGVVGPNADSRKALMGNYHGTSSRYITILEGIQQEVGDDIRVLYSEGCDLYQDKVEHLAWRQDRISEAVITAKHSDVVVIVVGLDETLEGEEGDTGNSYASGDKTDLHLPKVQEELIEAVTAVGKPTVVVLMAGSAMDMRYADQYCDGLLLAWYPGAQGGRAVSDILFGHVSPSGKLPVTFYKDLEGFPEFTDYAMKGRTYRYLEKSPLYPFGYGLTYAGKDLHISQAGICSGVKSVSNLEEADTDINWTSEICGRTGAGKALTVEIDKEHVSDITLDVTVSNESGVSTDDVVEVYIKDLQSDLAVKNGSLCAFRRVHLEAGESKAVTLVIPSKALRVVDERGERHIDSSKFRLNVRC